MFFQGARLAGVHEEGEPFANHPSIQPIMKIAVFCSANDYIAPEYFTLTEQLGKWMAEQGHSLVFGGCNLGLMECVAKAVHEAGGQTIGVVPSIIEERGRVSDYVDVEIPCNNLSDRKELMLAQSDVSIALPGGVGTLDEIFSVVAAHSIGYHQQQVILYNINGFWDSLVALLDDLTVKDVIRGDYHQQIKVAHSLEELKQFVES